MAEMKQASVRFSSAKPYERTCCGSIQDPLRLIQSAWSCPNVISSPCECQNSGIKSYVSCCNAVWNVENPPTFFPFICFMLIILYVILGLKDIPPKPRLILNEVRGVLSQKIKVSSWWI
jgi:hypothetical protein